MHVSTTLFAVATLASTAYSALNTFQEYRLRTFTKPHQHGKSQFNNLWLQGFHTGAGLNDATLTTNGTAGIKGFLNTTSGAQEFDLGTETIADDRQFPWAMTMAIAAGTYNAWDPVRIDAGAGGGSGSRGISDGFFINSTGLQWDSAPGQKPGIDAFGGWLVCDWWHSVPQLFFRLKYYHTAAPSSCADVYLYPEYI